MYVLWCCSVRMCRWGTIRAAQKDVLHLSESQANCLIWDWNVNKSKLSSRMHCHWVFEFVCDLKKEIGRIRVFCGQGGESDNMCPLALAAWATEVQQRTIRNKKASGMCFCSWFKVREHWAICSIVQMTLLETDRWVYGWVCLCVSQHGHDETVQIFSLWQQTEYSLAKLKTLLSIIRVWDVEGLILCTFIQKYFLPGTHV